jgi:proline racemase
MHPTQAGGGTGKLKDWQPPENWLRITTIDAHAAGEPFRVVTGGLPQLPGNTILARRRYMKHPFEADLSFLYGTIFIGPAESPEAHSRNV